MGIGWQGWQVLQGMELGNPKGCVQWGGVWGEACGVGKVWGQGMSGRSVAVCGGKMAAVQQNAEPARVRPNRVSAQCVCACT